MSARRSLFLGFLICHFAAAQELFAQCTGFLFLSSGSGDTIRLDGALISSTQLQQAAAYWSTCAGAGSAFPSFTTANVSADIQVTVQYHGGSNTACGQTTHISTTTMVVELWDHGLTTANTPYDCNVTDTLAHELGHVLDLTNSTCAGHLMAAAPISLVNGRQTAGTRSVAADECTAVRDRWTTSTERQGGGGGGGNPPCV
jgi:hypothetical protein